MTFKLKSALVFFAVCCSAHAGDASTGDPQNDSLETVVVVAPLPDAGLARDLVPANVQVFTSQQFDLLHALDVTQYLNRAAGSVFINEAQSNPLQPDLQFRGFTASPLLGLPQGLAIYQDGVRVNEAFGDTVNWALLPEFAIQSLTLVPGSNPVFGQNTLGGALVLRTKDGFDDPGARADLQGGEFSRINTTAEFGGSSGPLGYYIGGSYFDEDGWRDFSPSRSAQLFANLRYRRDADSLGISVTAVDTNLIGNGALPVQLLQQDRTAIFTRPDQTQNDLMMLNLNGHRRMSDSLGLDGVIYYRQSDIDTMNGDDSPYEQCDDDPELLCSEDGETVLATGGTPVAFGPEVSGATVNRSATAQDSYGTSLQLTATHAGARRNNHLTFGVAFDRSDIAFGSSTELGALDDTRLAVPAGVFPQDALTDLGARTRSYGIYFTDTLELGSAIGITFAGRYNSIDVELRDRRGTALNGDHDFSRFNPAVGISWRVSKAWQLYASIGEASRVPSPAELTCADEEDPCRLPNAFVSDPPLDQVVSRTMEAGARGAFGTTIWHVGAFRADNRDDILFISSGALTNEGFFDNVGRTRRQGIELTARGSWFGSRLTWSASYTAMEATFEEDFTVASGNNPAAVDGEIPVTEGDRIPGIPEHLAKFGLEFLATPRWSIGADMSYASDQRLRGDEGNFVAPLGGHWLLNLRTAYRLTDRMSVYALLDNALDEDYETFGVFGEPGEVLGDDYDDSRFVSPGSPRAAWVGVTLSL